MSKLEELIEELCPDGVEYKKIKDIADVSIGEFVHKSKQNPDAEYPVFNGGTSNTGFYDEYNRTANKIIISARGANAGFVNRVFTNFWSGNSCYTIDVKDNNVDWTYLYYWLKSKELKLLGEQQKGGIPAVSKKQVEDFSCPIPPLPVQEEIVRILDNFTDLTAELQAELQARAKQYEYYRDTLFDFGENVPRVKLSEIATIIRGGNFQKKDFIEDGFPCIHYGQMYTHFGISADKTLTFISDEVAAKSKIAEKNDIVMAVTSENVEDVCKCTAWVGDSDIAVSGHTAIIKHDQNAKFLSYYFHTTDFFKQKKKLAHGTKVIEVTPSALNDILIPLPSMDEQEKIVSLLDRFDNLVHDVSEGLPAEIEARQKQYEYYRNKILTFKELG